MAPGMMARCTCMSHECRRGQLGYTEVSRSTQQKHLDDDLELSLRGLSLNDLVQPVDNNIICTSSDPSGGTRPEDLAEQESDCKVRGLVLQLKSILDEYGNRLESFVHIAKSLDRVNGLAGRCNDAALLQDHISWMIATMSNLKILPVGQGDGLDLQRDSLVNMIQDKLQSIKKWQESHYDDLKSQRDQESHTCGLLKLEKHYEQPLSQFPPLSLLSMFIVVVLNTIHTLPDTSSNFLLIMHRKLLRLAFQLYGVEGGALKKGISLSKLLPKDIRTVRSRFRLEQEILVYAACPNCSALSEPTIDKSLKSLVYPIVKCNHKDLSGSECRANLLKWRVVGKQAIRVPIRPFGYRSLYSFLREMLSRPGYENSLERCPSVIQPDIITDIFDGDVIRNFRHKGKLCFFQNGGGTDLYLAWAISVDWFNPFHNKAAGKSVSAGVISMVCLNLPLHLRYEVSNMYVVGIIPGPREPSLHHINHFLEPLKNELLTSWQYGTSFPVTYKYSRGRRIFSVLIPLVADLPASRKVSGTAGHNAKCFCPLCTRKKGDVDDFSASFTKRSREEHVELATQWKNAISKKQRKDLVKENGIRYSVLFDLPYWEPQFIVVDTMHNLFLGLIRYHFRDIMGMDYKKKSATKRHELTAKKIKKLLELLKDPEGPTISKLRRYSNKDLYEFHKCQKLPLPSGEGNLKKDTLVLSLLHCDLVKKASINTAEHGPVDVLAHDELPFNALNDFLDVIPVAPQNTNRGVATSKRKGSPNTQGYLSPEELETICAAMKGTSRPSWQQGPPTGFGTSQQGKLKADQWRTLIEFDLPVALVEMWFKSETFDPDGKDARYKLLDLTMELAIAVFWGTSRRTSLEHAIKYTLHLQKYLRGLQTLSPRPKMMPNHHASLHVGDQLLLFGPVYGWWAYPYERVIGTLQKTNTNYRSGEMELTMLKSYYANARLHQLLQKGDCPKPLRDCTSTLEKFFPTHALGSYSSNLLGRPIPEDDDDDDDDDDGGGGGGGGTSKLRGHVMERLDDDVFDALCSSSLAVLSSEERQNRKVLVHKFYISGGIRYTSLESERDSIIFYQEGVDKSPGIIRKIILLSSGSVLFAVHSYLKPKAIFDPFTRWPDFRGGLWSQLVNEQVQIIDPNKTDICHAARRPWKDQEVYVLRPIDRNY